MRTCISWLVGLKAAVCLFMGSTGMMVACADDRFSWSDIFRPFQERPSGDVVLKNGEEPVIQDVPLPVGLSPALAGHEIILFPEQARNEGGTQIEVGSALPRIGYWDKKGAAALWTTPIPKSGEYIVQMTYASVHDKVASLEFKAGDETFLWTPCATGNCDDKEAYQTVTVGHIHLKQGEREISVRMPEDIPDYPSRGTLGLMWLGSLRLVPAKEMVQGIRVVPEGMLSGTDARFVISEKGYPLHYPFLGGWNRLSKKAQWGVLVDREGYYQVEMEYGSIYEPGKLVRIEANGTGMEWRPLQTNKEDPNVCGVVKAGSLFLKKGINKLVVQPMEGVAYGSKMGVMELAGIRLIPIEGETKGSVKQSIDINGDPVKLLREKYKDKLADTRGKYVEALMRLEARHGTDKTTGMMIRYFMENPDGSVPVPLLAVSNDSSASGTAQEKNIPVLPSDTAKKEDGKKNFEADRNSLAGTWKADRYDLVFKFISRGRGSVRISGKDAGRDSNSKIKRYAYYKGNTFDLYDEKGYYEACARMLDENTATINGYSCKRVKDDEVRGGTDTGKTVAEDNSGKDKTPVFVPDRNSLYGTWKAVSSDITFKFVSRGRGAVRVSGKDVSRDSSSSTIKRYTYKEENRFYLYNEKGYYEGSAYVTDENTATINGFSCKRVQEDK